MKRILGALLALLILVGGFVAALPLFVSSETVRSRLVTKLEHLTGRTINFQGNPTVSFNPFLGIELTNLTVADPNAAPGEPPLMNVERVQTQLDLFPALFGEVVITKYRFVRPSINLIVYPDGIENWSFDRGLLRDALESHRGSEADAKVHAKLGTFEILQGKVVYEDQISGTSEEISSLNTVFDWPETSKPARLDGTAIWRGENISFKANAANTISLAAGGSSEISITFLSAPLQLGFSGEANMISDLFVRGNMEASSPSLDRLSALLNINIDTPGPSGEWQISGNIEGTTRAATVTDAKVGIASLQATGVVSLAINETSQAIIDGTLAFDTINLPTLLETAEVEESSNSEDIAVSDLELDLRLSANLVRFDELELANMAAAVTMKEGNWVFDIGHSEAFGGELIAKLGTRQENGRRQSFLEATARNIDMETVSVLFPEGVPEISGQGDIDANLRSMRPEDGFEVGNLSGTVDAKLLSGLIQGVNFPALLQSNDNEEDSSTPRQLEVEGSTPFEEMTVTSFINNGLASIAKSSIISGDLKIRLFGNINFVDNGLALRAQQISDEGPLPDRLFIGGTLANPLVSIHAGPRLPNAPKERTLQPEENRPATIPGNSDTSIQSPMIKRVSN